MKPTKQVHESGRHASTGKFWARIRGKFGWVEQWGQTEEEAEQKCREFLTRHKEWRTD